MSFFKKTLPYFIVLILCFWAVKSLSVPGFFPIHDDEQIARLFQMDLAIKAGQIPPRWVPDLGFGYGFPLFNFYPPLIYYFGEFFHSIGFSFIDSTKLVLLSGFFLSSFSMYLWVKKHYGKIPGLFAAVLYTYAPYHAVDSYVRGAIPEFFSFVFIPLVLWALEMLFETRKMKYSLILSAFLVFVVLTHSLVALAFAPFFLIYSVFLAFLNRKYLKEIILLFSFSAVLSLGLSMYFWLPSLAEKKYTLVDNILTRELASYKLHFLYIRQFWNSSWGYGGSIYGLEDGLSFQVGKIQLISVFLSALSMVFAFFKKRLSGSLVFPAISLFLFFLSLYMTTFHSEWIWNLLSPFWYLQFPWRFLLFSAVFSSFLGGFFIYIVKNNLNHAISIFVALGLSAGVIFLNASYFQPARYLDVKDNYYTNIEDIEWRVSKMSFEYVPKDVKTVKSDINTTQLDIEKDDIRKIAYKVLKGNAEVKVISDKPQSKIFKVNALTNAIFQVNTFSFPGWEVSLDGKSTRFSDSNKLKLIVIDIPKGDHTVSVNFRDTMPRIIGNYVSIISLIFVLIWAAVIFKKNAKN